jgi:hypothetical protein
MMASVPTAHDKLRIMGLSERAIARKIIHQVINDFDEHNESHFLSAKQYVYSETFSEHLESSGYPIILRDTLKEMLLLSKPERQILCQEILTILSQIPFRE